RYVAQAHVRAARTEDRSNHHGGGDDADRAVVRFAAADCTVAAKNRIARVHRTVARRSESPVGETSASLSTVARSAKCLSVTSVQWIAKRSIRAIRVILTLPSHGPKAIAPVCRVSPLDAGVRNFVERRETGGVR